MSSEDAQSEREGRVLRLADHSFVLSLNNELVSSAEKESSLQTLEQLAKDMRNTPYMERAKSFGGNGISDADVTAAAKAVDEELKKCDENIADAKENLGEEEVRQESLKKAELLAEAGRYTEAIAVFKEIDEMSKTTTGQKIDIALQVLRIAFATDDFELMLSTLDQAKAYGEKGGDWERRNRIKVYEAVKCIRVRQFEQAAKLLLDAVATFTATELFDYQTFVLYVVVTSMITLERSTLKKRIVESPEILQVLHTMPSLQGALMSLHNCVYSTYFQSVVGVYDMLMKDRFFAPHAQYFLRQARIIAYRQYLLSYRSVKVETMAQAFGVGSEYLDKELSDLVFCGRIACKIDAVNGVIEAERADCINQLYQDTIKQGDRLLHRVQKLSRVITM